MRMQSAFFLPYIYGINFKNKNKMKIDWSTLLTIVLALVVYKLVDKFALSKINMLEESFN